MFLISWMYLLYVYFELWTSNIKYDYHIDVCICQHWHFYRRLIHWCVVIGIQELWSCSTFNFNDSINNVLKLLYVVFALHLHGLAIATQSCMGCFADSTLGPMHCC